MISRIYKCPICDTLLQERTLPYSRKDGEIYEIFQLECDTCGIFAKSFCDCTDSCTCDFHFNKAYESMKEGALFLKEFILRGGFNE